MEAPSERIEMARLGQDIRLFLRMARTHFTRPRDLAVIAKLIELSERYGAGIDIMKAEDADA